MFAEKKGFQHFLSPKDAKLVITSWAFGPAKSIDCAPENGQKISNISGSSIVPTLLIFARHPNLNASIFHTTTSSSFDPTILKASRRTHCGQLFVELRSGFYFQEWRVQKTNDTECIGKKAVFGAFLPFFTLWSLEADDFRLIIKYCTVNVWSEPFWLVSKNRDFRLFVT